MSVFEFLWPVPPERLDQDRKRPRLRRAVALRWTKRYAMTLRPSSETASESPQGCDLACAGTPPEAPRGHGSIRWTCHSNSDGTAQMAEWASCPGGCSSQGNRPSTNMPADCACRLSESKRWSRETRSHDLLSRTRPTLSLGFSRVGVGGGGGAIPRLPGAGPGPSVLVG